MRVEEPAAPVRATGLTEAEAQERRRQGQGNVSPPASSRTYGQIVRQNVFTFINDVLFALCVLLIIVGRPLDAVTSIAVILTNVVVSVVQEVRAKRQLERIALLTRPTATVRRDGVERQVSPEDLVIGDLLVVTPGDQVVLDGSLREGRVQVDESQLTGESDVLLKTPGMPVFSGSFCVTGSGAYEIEKVGADSLANRITAGARAFRRALTPLQQQVNLVIRIVLVIVVYMEIVTILSSVARRIDLPDAIAHSTVLATLVPNGLFISIAIAYALGAVRIIRFGALVQQANAVESLSNVDVLCLDKTGTLTLNRLRLEEWTALDGDDQRFKTILGVLAASTTTGNKTTEALAAALPADGLEASREVPFSSARKWSALSFEGQGGLRGTYLLGAPEMLEPGIDEAVGQNAMRRWIETRTQQGQRVLLVAHQPDPHAIPDGVSAEAALPSHLRPIGLVALSDTLRPDAAETLAQFAENGIDLKIISGDSPETVLALARQAGVGTELRTISGVELEGMDDEHLRRVAERTTVFGRVTPEQKEHLILALRAAGHYVAMIGDGVNDVLSLKRADLGVAIQSGSQAARGVADMVLTNDSFAAMLPAVREGRRILDGMQAILKLFLCRIATLALVVVSGLVIGVFPIQLRQGSALSLVTVGVPSVALAIWAHPRPPRRNLASDLVNFVAPVALVSSLFAVFLYCACWVLQSGRLPSATMPRSAAVVIERPAESCLVAFLILTGLLLVVFTRPPTRWWGVVERPSGDWRPALLAAALAIIFLVVWLTPLGDLFVLKQVGVLQMALTFAAVLLWLIVMRTFWRLRLTNRIGLET
ncbi:MAG: HAD-IC family P-type ATPase [Candidatus Dormibacteraceae bacterium]